MKQYVPHPIITNDVEVSGELIELSELLARNTHECWAKEKIAQGYVYGEKYDEINKTHPCIVDYDELSEDMKKHDRITSMETLKLIIKLGWKVERQ